jgi:hypothetical protein
MHKIGHLKIAQWISGGAFGVTLVLLVAFEVKEFDIGTKVLAAAWLIVPPLWFMFEWQFLWKGPTIGAEFDSFKHSQELAKNLWAGVAALLGLSIFLHHP